MTETVEGPGDALREAREALDVSTREVADALNLPMSVIEALEANDYERLPQPVFTRGYLRSYARLLELDPAAIVARYPGGAEDTLASGELAAVSETPGAAPADSRLAIGAGVLVLVMIVVVLSVWLWPEQAADEVGPAPTPPASDVPPQTSPGTAEPRAPGREPAGEVVVAPRSDQGRAAAPPREEAEARQPAVEAPPVIAPAAVQGTAVEGTEEAAAAAAEVAAEAVDAVPVEAAPAGELPPADREPPSAAQPALEAPTPAGFRRITPFGEDRLVVTFSEDCWVEVKDLAGSNLYSDLNRAGRTLQLIGAGPFRLLFGYAPGVTLEVNGEPIELARYTRNNVASLVVGR